MSPRKIHSLDTISFWCYPYTPTLWFLLVPPSLFTDKYSTYPLFLMLPLHSIPKYRNYLLFLLIPSQSTPITPTRPVLTLHPYHPYSSCLRTYPYYLFIQHLPLLSGATLTLYPYHPDSSCPHTTLITFLYGTYPLLLVLPLHSPCHPNGQSTPNYAAFARRASHWMIRTVHPFILVPAHPQPLHSTLNPLSTLLPPSSWERSGRRCTRCSHLRFLPR